MPVESNVYALWGAKQAGKASAVADTGAIKRFNMVAGDLLAARDDGSENFSDLDRFGDAVDFINTLVGQGNPALQATPNETAWLLYQFFGAETFTAKSVGVSPPSYVFQPGTTLGTWVTFWKRVGLTDIVRQKFVDCKLASLRLEGSTANKVVKVIPSIISLDPGHNKAADPTGTAVMPAQQPFLYTDGEAAFTIDGVVMRGASQFAIVIDDALAPYYGDGRVPKDVTPGNAQVTLEAITMVLDADSIAQYNKIVYGTATPAAGDKPRGALAHDELPAVGSYECNLSKTKAADGTALAADAISRLKIEIPKVKWSPDLAVPPNPGGGPVEISLAGQMRRNTGGTPNKIRITVETGAGDNVAHSTMG